MAGSVNLIALMFRKSLGFEQIPRWQLGVATCLFLALSLAQMIMASAG